MKYNVAGDLDNELDFGEMNNRFFLIGLLNEFMNRFQTVGDTFFKEISWKQCFLLICIRFFKQPPTLKELSALMGSSHQNVKQMLLKLEKAGFVRLMPDESDKRKYRIILTEKTKEFNERNDEPSKKFVNQLFTDVDEQKLSITIETIMQLGSQLQKMK